MSGRYIWINFPYLLDKFCPPWIDLFEAMTSVCSPRQRLILFLVLCEIPKYLILELTGMLQTSVSAASGTARTSHSLTFNVKPDDIIVMLIVLMTIVVVQMPETAIFQ